MKQEGYRSLFHQHAYVQMFSADIISRFGDAIDMIAFSWMVYALTNSPAWSAVVLGVNMIPNVIIQPFAGALVERLSKKRVMILCDLARFAITAMTAVLYSVHLLSPWLLLIITFMNNTLESFRNPASVAFFPKLLPQTLYEAGISFQQSTSRLCELAGAALAGMLLGWIGISGAIGIDAVTFLLSAVIISKLSIKEERNVIKAENSPVESYWHTLKEGVAYLHGQPILLVICLLAAMINTALVPYNSFQAPYISGVLHQKALLLSVSSTLLSLGIMLGSVCYPMLHRRITHRVMILAGTIGISIFYGGAYGISFFHSTAAIYISLGMLSLLFGFLIAQMLNTASVAIIQKVPQDYLARVSSMFNSISTLSMPLASFAIGAISVQLSVISLYLYFALFTFVLFVGMIFVKSLKEL